MPNRFGLAIFQPELNQAGVSAKAELFCRLLAAKYRINLFDNVSTRGAQRRAETAFCEDEQWQRTHFFRACAATLDRNVDTVARYVGICVCGVTFCCMWGVRLCMHDVCVCVGWN